MYQAVASTCTCPSQKALWGPCGYSGRFLCFYTAVASAHRHGPWLHKRMLATPGFMYGHDEAVHDALLLHIFTEHLVLLQLLVTDLAKDPFTLTSIADCSVIPNRSPRLTASSVAAVADMPSA